MSGQEVKQKQSLLIKVLRAFFGKLGMLFSFYYGYV